MASLNKMNPTVGVVVPCYNGEKLIKNTLDSLLSQTYIPDEIVVVDDGSVDDTAKVLENYNGIVRTIRQSNSGASSARHLGVNNINSDIVIFNDTGDISLAGRIEKLRKGLIKNPDCVAACSATWLKPREKPDWSNFIGKPLDGSIIVVENSLEKILCQSWPPAIGMNIAIWRDVALLSTQVPPFYRAANDYALQAYTACHGDFAYIAEVTLECEFLKGGITEKYGWMQQTGYALCAAVECYERESRKHHLNEKSFRLRVIEAWPGILLHAYLNRNFPLFRKIFKIGIKYGSLKRFPRNIWWALNEALEEGKLNNSILIKNFVKSTKYLQFLIKKGFS